MTTNESTDGRARMFVHESGAPSSPAVVFLHGAGASGSMWREHMTELAGRFYCLAPDFPGFGRSNHLAARTLLDTTDAVAQLIETRVPAGRAHIVGLSYGGGVAHMLLEHHPDLIGRAVIDGAGVLSWWGGPLVLFGITVASPFLHTRPVTALFGNIVGMDEAGRNDLRASSRMAFWRAWIEGFAPRPVRVRFGVSSPTLFVAGEKETAVRPSNAALAALMPHAVARFAPGLPHAWLARRRELHVRMVEAWLAGQELPSELIPEKRSPFAEERLLYELERDLVEASERHAA